MRTSAWRIGSAGLLAVALFAWGSMASSAQVPPTPVPSAAHQAPAAPSGIQLNLGQGLLSWTDNSTDEDGFRISITTRRSSSDELYREDHTTGPNETSVQASSVEKINSGDSVLVNVVAFNSAGDSTPAMLGRSIERGLVLPTRVPPAAQLPGTGYGRDVAPVTAPYSVLVLTWVAVSVIALAVAVRRKSWR